MSTLSYIGKYVFAIALILGGCVLAQMWDEADAAQWQAVQASR